MTRTIRSARFLALAAIAALALDAATPGSARALSIEVDPYALVLVDTHAISSIDAHGNTVTTITEYYKSANGRTKTVTKTHRTSAAYPVPGGYDGGGDHTPPPLAYPEYDPDWTPAPLAYPETDPYRVPGHQVNYGY